MRVFPNTDGLNIWSRLAVGAPQSVSRTAISSTGNFSMRFHRLSVIVGHSSTQVSIIGRCFISFILVDSSRMDLSGVDRAMRIVRQRAGFPKAFGIPETADQRYRHFIAAWGRRPARWGFRLPGGGVPRTRRTPQSKVTTLRIDLPSCMRLKALLISASGIV